MTRQHNTTHSSIEEGDKGPMLAFIWGQYRTWALTSRQLKKVLGRWKVRVFILVTLGAFAGVLSEQVTDWGGSNLLAQCIAGVSGLSVALASYAGSEILTQQREQYWLRSRAAAEAFKREAYLYLLGAPPYHLPGATQRAFARIEELVAQMADVPSSPITREAATKRLPDLMLTIDDYVEERVSDQVYQYYRPKAAQYLTVLNRGKLAAYVLGFLGVILGTAAANGIAGVSVWIAFISATSASIATFISTNRYEYLSMSYQAAANRLLMLTARYEQVDRSDSMAQLRFIAEVEATIAIENSAWMVELSTDENEEAETPPQEPTTDHTNFEGLEGPVESAGEETSVTPDTEQGAVPHEPPVLADPEPIPENQPPQEEESSPPDAEDKSNRYPPL